jgi:hypothetical protein
LVVKGVVGGPFTPPDVPIPRPTRYAVSDMIDGPRLCVRQRWLVSVQAFPAISLTSPVRCEWSSYGVVSKKSA